MTRAPIRLSQAFNWLVLSPDPSSGRPTPIREAWEAMLVSAGTSRKSAQNGEAG
jgi:hypothetical protein